MTLDQGGPPPTSGRKAVSSQWTHHLRVLPSLCIALGIVLFATFRQESSQHAEPGIPSMLPETPSADVPNPAPEVTQQPATASPARVVASDGASTNAEERQAAFQALPQTEQESLWQAFSAAQRKIRPLTPAQMAQPRNAGVRYFAGNPSQHLTARFLDGAVRLESGRGGEWAGTLSLAEGAEVTPMVDGDRAEYRHPGGVTEWYVNRPEGIEHGFTLTSRPANAVPGKLRVDLALEGLTARAVEAEEALEFVDPVTGEAVLRYGKLLVWDATGRELPAGFQAQDEQVAILVADAGATYPLTIDPLITSQEQKLLALEPDRFDRFGDSVALEGDTALIGAIDNGETGIFAGSAYVFVRSGMAWSQQARLLPADAAANDFFGYSVALAGNTALVGAFRDDDAGMDSGSAYVFVRSGTAWSQQAKLVAADGAEDDQFGIAVALAGDTALVGAPDDDDAGADSGSAYVFVRSGTAWSQQAKLVAADAAAADSLGRFVALAGDTALAGAHRDDHAGASSGSAYVFARSGTNWTQQTKLIAADAAEGDRFGWSVALSSDTALVGAHRDDDAGENSGSAYVFVRSGTNWTQQAKLVGADGAPDDSFAWSVALSGDTALVGALNDDDAGANSGSAYVYARNGTAWSQQGKLVAPDAAAQDNFGWSVGLSGDTALVAAYRDDDLGADSGSAHVFVRNGAAWSQEQKLVALDGAPEDEFGTTVALEGDTALIGAPMDDDAGTDSGSAYVMVRNGNQWSHLVKLAAADGAGGDEFGGSVALSSNHAVVGAQGDDDAGMDSGSAYVFLIVGTNWTQQAKLVAADGAVDDRFGTSVALSGNRALIGAPMDDDAGTDSGSAYVFRRSGTAWPQEAKLGAADGDSDHFFGRSVALSGDTALIGAYGDDHAGARTGSAYVFVRDFPGWNQQAKLVDSEGTQNDLFGFSVAVSDDTALVGARGDDDAGSASGSAHVFTRSGTVWTRQAKLVALDGAAVDLFGDAVALSGDIALVGAYQDDDAGENSGSAYVFVRSGTAWSQEAKLTASDSAAEDRFGSALALSGDTALVGAYQDDDAGSESGSVFVFRLFLPEITVEQPLGTALADGTGSIDFGNVAVGRSAARSFTITNTGTGDLTSIAVTKDGPDAGALTVDTTGMVTELPPGGSTTFTATFTAAGAVTTPQSAHIHIASNALGTKNPFDIALAGTVLSPLSDTDSDGLNDAAEWLMVATGFDWQVSQSAMVTAFLSDSALYTLSQVQALNVDVPLIQMNPTTGLFTVTIAVEKTTDLGEPFTAFPLDSPGASTMISTGKLEFTFPVPDDAAFFRLESH